jgi:type I restriction enzyme R subunit
MTKESERQTRRERIDPKLRAAKWTIVPVEEQGVDTRPGLAVEELETANGPADYGLFDESRCLGVVEAKKLTLGPQEVLTQAQRYSRGIDQKPLWQGEYGAPFLYSTNGEIIRFQDARHPMNRSRPIAAFHTPAALHEMLERDFDVELNRLAELPMPPQLRPYQIEANQSVEQVLRERKRKMLVAMATGTGKTLTTVSQVYRLMKSGAARRVLFLVDRRALAAQAVRAFSSFEAEPGLKFDKLYELYSQRFHREDYAGENFDPKVLPTSYLTDPKLGLAFVYVSTIQRMTINLLGRDAVFRSTDEAIDDDAEKLDIPIHAFDLIVADECHRGYSAKELSIWRATLDHFDAVKIGLTATPAAHTTAYFENVAFRYEYDRAVREGYLVDYDVVAIDSDVRMNGVFLDEGEQIEEVDTMSGVKQLDLLEDEVSFDSSKIEREITAPRSNRRILEEIKKYAVEHEKATGRFPKTLIFADNDLPHTSHADQLVDTARDVFGRGEAFVAKITGRVDRPLQRIREFRNRPNPGIVVSVDLMTTGVDIPDLEYIVFLRPVKSRILFEQMLGRGTRLGERHPDKSHFVVFDCFAGTLLEFFRNSTAITTEPPEPDGKTISQIIEEIWQNQDRDYNVRRLTKRLHRIDRQMSGDARELFARYVSDGDIGRFAEALPGLLKANFTETMKLLRDTDFQKLLIDYPRPKRVFVVAPAVEDTVESEWLIRDGTGQEYKPEDYLTAFETFVREHGAEIEAISVLLERPQGWSSETLRALREALSRAPEHFTWENLELAFRVAKHKALVDIISMVKNAALVTSPLYTAEERVDFAVESVTADRELTDEQAKWMQYIRDHLVQNLSIDREDFDLVPVLSSRGGWGRANDVFDRHLEELLADLNKELVAA